MVLCRLVELYEVSNEVQPVVVLQAGVCKYVLIYPNASRVIWALFKAVSNLHHPLCNHADTTRLLSVISGVVTPA